MTVYTFLIFMTDDLKDKSYVELKLYNVPNMKMGFTPVKNLLNDAPDEILNATVKNYSIKVNEENGCLMFTLVIKM